MVIFEENLNLEFGKMVTRTDAEAPAAKEEIPHDHLFKVTGLSSSNLEKLAQGRWCQF